MTGILRVGADVAAFREAVEAFVKRFAIKPEDLLALGQYAHDRAFTLAGATHLAVIEAVRQSLLDAVEHGTPLDEWRKAISQTLRREFGKRQPGEGLPARLETIYRNAVQKAYNTGRHRQMTTPTMVAIRPYWLLDVILDLRTSEICEALGRPPVCLPLGDPFWQSHWPPLHHKCRTLVRALRRREAQHKVRQPPPDAPAIEGDWGRTPDADEPWRPDVPEPAEQGWQAGQDKTPPRPAAVEIGRHVLKASGTDADQVLRFWSEAGVAPGLERLPLNELSIEPDILEYRRGGETARAAGLYTHTPVRRLQIWHGFRPSPFMAPYTLADAAMGEIEARRTLALHEIGHHFSVGVRGGTHEMLERFRRATPVTPYARTCPGEWFAESFSLYFIDQSRLEREDPEGYAIVREVLLYYGCVQ